MILSPTLYLPSSGVFVAIPSHPSLNCAAHTSMVVCRSSLVANKGSGHPCQTESTHARSACADVREDSRYQNLGRCFDSQFSFPYFPKSRISRSRVLGDYPLDKPIVSDLRGDLVAEAYVGLLESSDFFLLEHSADRGVHFATVVQFRGDLLAYFVPAAFGCLRRHSPLP